MSSSMIYQPELLRLLIKSPESCLAFSGLFAFGEIANASRVYPSLWPFQNIGGWVNVAFILLRYSFSVINFWGFEVLESVLCVFEVVLHPKTFTNATRASAINSERLRKLIISLLSTLGEQWLWGRLVPNALFCCLPGVLAQPIDRHKLPRMASGHSGKNKIAKTRCTTNVFYL